MKEEAAFDVPQQVFPVRNDALDSPAANALLVFLQPLSRLFCSRFEGNNFASAQRSVERIGILPYLRAFWHPGILPEPLL